MKLNKIVAGASLLIAPFLVRAQGGALDPADILKPLSDSWPTYSGDYSGKRFSALKQVDKTNVQHLTLAWSTQVSAGTGGDGDFRRRRGQGNAPTIVGGEGPGDINIHGGTIKASALMVDGTLYFTMPDNAWAVDARDGHILWHYFWKTKGGTHIGNRGVGMWHGYLFMETPDDYLVSLDAKTGKERWHKVIANVDDGYFSTPAPVVVGNHVLVGTGNDIDSPGFLQSFDPETGELQWKHYTVPMEKGDPGLDTWASLDAARHGGAQTWVPGGYDPETKLYIFSTGNPTPAFTNGTRGPGANLFTCALIAVNVDTGKMAWYYQTSPHDMHDYDSAQTPVLVDAPFNGKTRKLALTASRNGYYFTVDRVTGEHLVTSKWGEFTNWADGLTPSKGPKLDPEKNATVGGSLVSPGSDGTVNWEPPAFSPQTGLFYVSEHNSFSEFYLTDLDPRGSMGLGGKEEAEIGSAGTFLTAIDYKTGKVAWRHPYYSDGGGGGGLLATAGGLIFGGDGAGSLVAHDAATGKPLWNTRIGYVSNAPQTFLLDGLQYVIAAAGDTLWAFVMY
ncbi:MAG TPA: acido-empty-quinoprotein group A [Bryobacteraceae bacterium]|jgi:alcohol dehydrogenase (cytochrome c)|nr:acido-empty-quinoprotein group A [Bryobacteraceae bacterium]